MQQQKYFMPTPLYKEYQILDILSKNEKMTQRKLSHFLDVAVSMINAYLSNYESLGYIEKIYYSTKTIHYKLTDKGHERLKVLNIGFLEASLNIYELAKKDISVFLDSLIKNNFKKLLFYGAGEVCEIILQTLNNHYQDKLECLALIDDDTNKQGKIIVNKKVISLSMIDTYIYDGIFITSYTNQEDICEKLVSIGYSKDKIIRFFK